MHIGFDLDKIFIKNPPLIPSWLITKLYGEKVNGKLTYRFPRSVEQYVRKLSHVPPLRQPILTNINLVRKMKNKKDKFFLISSRYGFLRKETEQIINKYQLDNIFSGMYFNYQNKQPHEFKKEMILKLHIQKFVDDDLPLLLYLAHEFPNVIFFWFNTHQNKQLGKNLFAITHLSQVFTT